MDVIEAIAAAAIRIMSISLSRQLTIKNIAYNLDKSKEYIAQILRILSEQKIIVPIKKGRCYYYEESIIDKILIYINEQKQLKLKLNYDTKLIDDLGKMKDDDVAKKWNKTKNYVFILRKKLNISRFKKLDFKHGLHGYMNKQCRCKICYDAVVDYRNSKKSNATLQVK